MATPFAQSLERLQAFVQREGHARVPYDHREGEYGLGAWVSRQRRRYRDGVLTPEEARQLGSLPGWTWDPHDDSFERMFDLAKEYARRHGHLRTSRRVRFQGADLHTWAVNQRALYREAKIEPDRAARLESLLGWSWAPWEESFDRALELLRGFARKHGHTLIPVKARMAGFPLGSWVAKRRSELRRGLLPAAQARQLKAVPEWTSSPREERFQTGLMHLKRFAARRGHCRVPRNHVEGGFALGNWVTARRVAYREGSLSEQRRAELEALRGWTWEARDVRFAEGLSRLREFRRRYGHLRVPRGHVEHRFPLGAWFSSVRSQYGRGTLSSKKIAALERLRGWSWNFRARTGGS
jgi:hypothetical protein